MFPLEDESRRLSRFPIVTAFIIALNVLAFILELMGGDAFVTQWSVIPVDIVAGRHLITILTALFMHASWSHILGNMVFLWAFGPEIEDAMNPGGVLPRRRSSVDARASRSRSRIYGSQSGCERSDRRCYGGVSGHLPAR
jgi:rhomboid family protein